MYIKVSSENSRRFEHLPSIVLIIVLNRNFKELYKAIPFDKYHKLGLRHPARVGELYARDNGDLPE